MCAIRPIDFYRCIMSPNMMLARTRPLPFQQGPFFALFMPDGGCALSGLRDCRPGKRSATGQSITACAQLAPRAAGQDNLRRFYCGHSDRGNQPATR
ncbi:hypothetical protein AM352_13560 [Citrobacter koseri]|nr:hypothetical protein AM352_13560 [Citrobacter koseri]PWY11403.1 hypothetical protein DL345_18130 [Citrobacter koseri]